MHLADSNTWLRTGDSAETSLTGISKVTLSNLPLHGLITSLIIIVSNDPPPPRSYSNVAIPSVIPEDISVPVRFAKDVSAFSRSSAVGNSSKLPDSILIDVPKIDQGFDLSLAE